MYKIANVNFEGSGIFINELKDFISDTEDINDEPVFYVKNRTIESSSSVFDNYLFSYSFNSLMIYNKSILAYDKDLKNAHIISENSECFLALLLQFFYMVAINKKMICMHSSLVEYQGNGVMFLGPSGIGKTTQAELWYQYRGAKIINGDIVFVQEKEDAFLGWGTPWHGSSVYCENDSVPVKALIVLKQSDKNEICKLNGFRKLETVLKSIYYPQGADDKTELCLNILDNMLKKISVYELACRPEKEAVEIVEKMIFR